MNKVSILDLYRTDIAELISTGASIRSVWKIISAKMPDNIQMSYNGFYRYCKRYEIVEDRFFKTTYPPTLAL
jgi:hypothetical protein